MPPTSAAKAQKLQNLVDTVLDTIVDGVITINEKGEIQSYNPACRKLFGYTADEVIGKNVHMLMPSPYKENHDSYIKNYRETGDAKIIGIGREVSGQRKDGTVFPMELAVGATHEGGDHAFVGIIRDITERHLAEMEREQLRQSQKMEALGQLTGGIAHDFNNLLAIILGNLDFLSEEIMDEALKESFVMPSIEAAEKGSELTQMLLAFGRKQTLRPEFVDPNDLLMKFIRLISRTLEERIDIRMSLSPDVWPCYVDVRQLENALLNLALNARDAMPKGGRLIFETENVYLDEDYAQENLEVVAGEYTMIAVSDSGFGMAHDVIEKAFDPFFTTKTVGKGTGLGLSMVYGFVKQSQGHIKLYSEPGFGTTVKIYLPRNMDSVGYTAPIRTVDPNNEDMPRAPENTRVLVVEDNASVLKMTSSMLESLGYIVEVASTGEQASDILKKDDGFTLLLTDVMLPGAINGPILAQEAISLYPSIKVLFCSGYAEHAIFQSDLLSEDVHLLSKPFRKTVLAKKLIEVLNNGDA